jgi:Ca2+-binding RTX toxin-like protein
MSDQHLIGTELDDVLIGAEGNDLLEGLGGNDYLDGGVGQDTMAGGAGDDTYIVDNAGDQVVENPDEGIDTVESSITQYQLTDNVENLTLVGPAWSGIGNDAANTITGNSVSNYILGGGGDDTLIGDAGNDILRGGDGNDILLGGEGNDWLEGGAGNDTYIRYNEAGSDLISDTAQPGAGNQLYLATLLSSEVQLDYSGMFLELKNLSGELLVSLTGFSHLDALSPFRAVEEFRFADGTVIGYDDLLARGFDIHATGNVSEDYVEGTNLQDRIYGSGQAEALIGYAGDDRLDGGGGDDTLQGMEGNDSLYGGTGDDELLGGVGSDTYYFDRIGGHDRILELVELADDHGDVDSLVFDYDILPEDLSVSLDSLGRLVIGINGSDATLLFNEWFNTEISTRVERFVFQNGTVLTDDDITALLNDAPVLANPLADQTARDTVAFSFTVPADAFVDPDTGDTLAYAATLSGGGALPSWLAFDAATHTFSGTPVTANIGNAFDVQVTATDTHGASVSDVFTITVDVAPDQTILGTEGDDILVGASGNDTIFGLGGADRMEGGLGNDTLWGLAGNDVLDGGIGADVMRGGAGDDVYRIDNSGDQVLESANEGIDTIETPFATTLGANIENVTLLGTAAVGATGNGFDNVFDGRINVAANVFTGLGGNDTYYLGAGDSAVESSGGGTDTIVVGSTWILGSNFENLTLAGNAAINGTGNSSANILTGNSAANVLTGGLGNDTYYVGAGDSVVEASGAGVDLVVSDVSWTLAAYVENLTLVGTAAIDGTGNGYDNVIIGNSAANVLTGGIGDDTYYVGAGDTVVENSAAGVDTVISDVSVVLWHFVEHLTLTGTADLDGTGTTWHNHITGNAGNNVLSGALGNDTLDGRDGNDTLLGGDDDDTLNGGNGNDALFGGNDDDFLYGGIGSDTISGDAGNDRIEGDAGNDTLTGGAGTDSFVFDAPVSPSNADVITDFQSVDRILLDHAVMTALGATGNFTPNDQRFWASGSGTAHDSTDRILYNTNTGELWYDPDGVLSMSRQLIATLQDDPTLLATQISVI